MLDNFLEKNKKTDNIFLSNGFSRNNGNIGIVEKVGDGILYASGLENAGAGATVIVFSSYLMQKYAELGQDFIFSGVVLDLRRDFIGIAILTTDRFIRPGDLIILADDHFNIGISYQLLGRTVDAFGHAIDGKEIVEQELSYRPIEVKAPGIIARKSVNEPVQTGIKAIDSMIPIGRGQRELIIGDRQTGKTTVAINTISMQAIENIALDPKTTEQELIDFVNKVYCIYVGVGQRRSLIVNLQQLLIKYDSLDTSILLSATSSESAVSQYLAPYSACTIGEYFRDNAMHSSIIYDDLSKHAVSYRQISLLLRRPPSREAYPGDVFYLHSRLLERAAKLSEICGLGSLTALPVIETQKGDVSAYIPTNVISITDGQIFSETDLFYNGVRPAISVGLSVSRVGSAAQNSILKKISSSLRFDLAQYRTVALLQALSSDLDPTTKHQIERGSRLVELLKQSPYRPFLVEQQIFVLYAVMHGFFDSTSVNSLLKIEQFLLKLYTIFDLILIELIKIKDLEFDFFTYYLDNFFLVNLKNKIL
jgi:F-type H+-transporting ATPase subunit alpha